MKNQLTTHNSKLKTNVGSISILILVFGLVFSIAISGLVVMTATQYTSSTRTEVYEEALSIAQAGAEYYRWHLSHAPTDYQDGTNTAGPYVHQIDDAYGNTTGIFSLTITPPSTGSATLTITSQGWMNSHPDIKRTVVVRYGIPALTKYAYLQNANMWIGHKTTVNGPLFSNGGIRMEGTNTSTVQSAKETYTCGADTGCDPSETKPGVWGSGGPANLWQFPVNAIDFNKIVVDFNSMKAAAQTSGVYLAPSDGYGYHLIFTSDGNVTIKKITGAKNQKGWSVDGGCENLYQTIQTEQAIGTYSIAQKPVIFAEDHLWVDGIVKGRVTVIAAKFPIDLNNMNIWINNNLTYITQDGSNQTGLIAQNNIYFPLSIPKDYVIHGGLIAQKGKILRHNYKYKDCNIDNEAVRQTLTILGSIISNQKSYWNYGTGLGEGDTTGPVSGFGTRTLIYDPYLEQLPPPYFPVQGEYQFLSWEER